MDKQIIHIEYLTKFSKGPELNKTTWRIIGIEKALDQMQKIIYQSADKPVLKLYINDTLIFEKP